MNNVHAPPKNPQEKSEILRFARRQIDQVLDVKPITCACCEDLAYLDWALERIHARANGKPINNPAGYLLSTVGLPDWISAWRHETAMRAAVRRPAAPVLPAGPPEPDNPAEVDKLLEELPWKPGGKRKDAPALPAQGGTS